MDRNCDIYGHLWSPLIESIGQTEHYTYHKECLACGIIETFNNKFVSYPLKYLFLDNEWNEMTDKERYEETLAIKTRKRKINQ